MFSADSINMQPNIPEQKDLFIVILLFSLQVESVVEKGSYWSLDTDHLYNLDTSVVTWNKTSFTALTCLINCAFGSSCKSVFYHPQRHICMASSSYKRALPENEKTDSGWMYYSEQHGCDGGYTHFGSNGLCVKAYKEYRNFHDAMGVCEAEGAKLASYNTQQELSDMHGLFKNSNAFVWIGMTDLVKDGEWKFWNGKTPKIVPWYPNEPNGGVNENCAAMWYNYTLLIDYNCADPLFFICQRYLP